MELGTMQGAAGEIPLRKRQTCNQDGKRRQAHQDELVVFAYAAEAIRSPVAADLVKGDTGDEGGVSLTSCYHPLLPWRKDGHKVILPTRLGAEWVTRARREFRGSTYENESAIRRPSDASQRAKIRGITIYQPGDSQEPDSRLMARHPLFGDCVNYSKAAVF